MSNNKVFPQYNIKNPIKSNRVFPQTLIIPDEEIDCDFVNMIVTKNIGLHEENIASNKNEVLPQNKILIIPDKEIIVNQNIRLTEKYIGINENKRIPK